MSIKAKKILLEIVRILVGSLITGLTVFILIKVFGA